MSTTPEEGQEKQQVRSDVSRLTKDLGWWILRIALKAALILFLANFWLLPYFGLPTIEFGHAFALVAIVSLLFSNLDGYSKFSNSYLFEIRQILNQLHINQFYQNQNIADKLDKLKDEVDESKKESYNTDESEKK